MPNERLYELSTSLTSHSPLGAEGQLCFLRQQASSILSKQTNPTGLDSILARLDPWFTQPLESHYRLAEFQILYFDLVFR